MAGRMLVTPEEVKAFAMDWKVFEVDWRGVGGRDQYLAAHIPGAEYLSIQDHLSISREQTKMPFDRQTDPAAFAESLRDLGIKNAEEPIVLYARGGAIGVMGATRAWWVLASWGFENIALLDGGWEAWETAGFSASSGMEKKPIGKGFFAQDTLLDKAFMRADAQAVVYAQDRGSAVIMDTLGGMGMSRWPNTAAPYGKKLGVERTSHIEGAMNAPCVGLLSESGCWKSKNQILEYFITVGYDIRRPVITYCGGGICATMNIFAMALAQTPAWTQRKARLYDDGLIGAVSDVTIRFSPFQEESKL